MVEVVQMSLKEVDRYAVIQQVIQRTMGQSDAALWLNLSVRQVKRLVRAIRQDGAQGAVSKRWGVPSNRRISQVVRDPRVNQTVGGKIMPPCVSATSSRMASWLILQVSSRRIHR